MKIQRGTLESGDKQDDDSKKGRKRDTMKVKHKEQRVLQVKQTIKH